ncbi:MAG TPA: hypothetical protein VD978_09980 [Azospirillum sp.]|nr:hypothetical protein [Azospirillum sp.]
MTKQQNMIGGLSSSTGSTRIRHEAEEMRAAYIRKLTTRFINTVFVKR